MLHRRCSSEKGIQFNRIALIDSKSVKYSCIATSWDLWILFVPQECSLFADRKPVTSYAKMVTVHISHHLKQNWLQCMPGYAKLITVHTSDAKLITVHTSYQLCKTAYSAYICHAVTSWAKLVTVYTSYQLRKTDCSAYHLPVTQNWLQCIPFTQNWLQCMKEKSGIYQWLCTRPDEVSPLPTLLWLPQSWAKLSICIYNCGEYYAKPIVYEHNMGVYPVKYRGNSLYKYYFSQKYNNGRNNISAIMGAFITRAHFLTHGSFCVWVSRVAADERRRYIWWANTFVRFTA